MGRTTREEVIDRLFLLKLLQLLRDKGMTTGLTKLQKLVFLAEEPLSRPNQTKRSEQGELGTEVVRSFIPCGTR